MEVKRQQKQHLQELNPALAGRPKKAQREGIPQAPEKSEALKKWGAWAARRDKNRRQERYIFQQAKGSKDAATWALALKAAASLHWCGSRQIVQQIGAEFLPVGSFNCGKKFCAHCSARKRRKILSRFADFFTSDQGRELLEQYDLALFTVTLQHTAKGLRSKPYYKELSQHFRNALKYGSFKKYIHGGFYNTEHTHTRNGHHIHRHALVLIPRQYDTPKNFALIMEELREQWKSRTGGSFQIDLRPLGWNETTETAPTRPDLIRNIKTHLLEVTKYITKRDKSGGVIPWEVIRSVEENNRAKFYGRFGILHRIAALKMNLDNDEADEKPKEPRRLFVGTPSITLKKRHETRPGKRIKKQKTRGKFILQNGRPVFQYDPQGTEHIRVKRIEDGPPLQIYTKLIEEAKPAPVKTWEKYATAYTFKNLVPIEDTPEAISRVKENIRHSLYEWRQEKWNNRVKGYDVQAWKQSRHTLQNIGIENLAAWGIHTSAGPDLF